MTPNDDTQDEELLARYRQASADAAGPSDAVRDGRARNPSSRPAEGFGSLPTYRLGILRPDLR